MCSPLLRFPIHNWKPWFSHFWLTPRLRDLVVHFESKNWKPPELVFHHAPAVILPKACWESSYRPVQLDSQFLPKRDPRAAGPHNSFSSFSNCLRFKNSSNLLCPSMFAPQKQNLHNMKTSWKHASVPTNWESNALSEHWIEDRDRSFS